MKNTITAILRRLRGLKIQSIVTSHKTVLTGLLLLTIIVLAGFQRYQTMKVTLLENEQVIYYSQEKKNTRDNIEFLNNERRELYEELAKEVNYDDCINNQIIRLFANEIVDMEYCTLIEDSELDEEGDLFIDNLLKGL